MAGVSSALFQLLFEIYLQILQRPWRILINAFTREPGIADSPKRENTTTEDDLDDPAYTSGVDGAESRATAARSRPLAQRKHKTTSGGQGVKTPPSRKNRDEIPDEVAVMENGQETPWTHLTTGDSNIDMEVPQRVSDEIGRPYTSSLGFPDNKSSEAEGSVVQDAGFSLGSPNDMADQAPEYIRPFAEFGTQLHTGNECLSTTSAEQDFNQRSRSLGERIRANRVPSAESRGELFMPVDQLERIMTHENVHRELYDSGLRDQELTTITETLCQRRGKSRQRIFAILCMLELPRQIVKFVDEAIFDVDLPFHFEENKMYRNSARKSNDLEVPIALFNSPDWKPMHLDSFYLYQGQLSAPIFKFNWTMGERVYHYSLRDQLVLPFMSLELTSGNNELASALQHGGTSTVRKVKIHSAHYNPPPTTVSIASEHLLSILTTDKASHNDICFAVKEIHPTRRPRNSMMVVDDAETIALKHLNTQEDPHLIRLLATYTYHDRFHLIFPWAAGGNLRDFWEALNARADHENRSAATMQWMSSQILGLAQALQKIHCLPIENVETEGSSTNKRMRLYGRHGDLKPENILWFKHESESDDKKDQGSLGVLKIADFGFADFHTIHSRSNVSRKDVGGFTETYKAPEFDVSQHVSPQFDIWSFGCILMQFIVWYLQGWEGVDDFSKERAMDSKGALIMADTFFTVEDGGQGRVKAHAKQSVVEVSDSGERQYSSGKLAEKTG
jgi:hypothetical protein